MPSYYDTWGTMFLTWPVHEIRTAYLIHHTLAMCVWVKEVTRQGFQVENHSGNKGYSPQYCIE